jgi:hypothetical protein
VSLEDEAEAAALQASPARADRGLAEVGFSRIRSRFLCPVAYPISARAVRLSGTALLAPPRAEEERMPAAKGILW